MACGAGAGLETRLIKDVNGRAEASASGASAAFHIQRHPSTSLGSGGTEGTRITYGSSGY